VFSCNGKEKRKGEIEAGVGKLPSGNTETYSEADAIRASRGNCFSWDGGTRNVEVSLEMKGP